MSESRRWIIDVSFLNLSYIILYINLNRRSVVAQFNLADNRNKEPLDKGALLHPPVETPEVRTLSTHTIHLKM